MRHPLLLLLTENCPFFTGDPLSGATVSLTKASDSSTIKLAVTKARGRVKKSAAERWSYWG